MKTYDGKKIPRDIFLYAPSDRWLKKGDDLHQALENVKESVQLLSESCEPWFAERIKERKVHYNMEQSYDLLFDVVKRFLIWSCTQTAQPSMPDPKTWTPNPETWEELGEICQEADMAWRRAKGSWFEGTEPDWNIELKDIIKYLGTSDVVQT